MSNLNFRKRRNRRGFFFHLSRHLPTFIVLFVIAREFDTFPNEKQRISRMNAYIFLSNLLFLCIGFFRLFVL